MLGTAYDNIWLDTHSLKFFYACLGRFCLQFSGSRQIWNQCNMDQDCIIVSHFMLELTDCLQERLTFDITNSSTHFNNSDLCLFCCKITEETALDLICDVRDYLHSSSAIITAALFL